jgi:ABC-2 type transport system ATP-binding protein
LTAALLHQPRILFLDEPTIGLDINAKESIRLFLKRINQERHTTILLTTHDLGDVEELCRRVMVIDRGQIIQDGDLSVLRRRFGHRRLAIFDLEREGLLNLPPGTNEVKREGKRVWVEFDGKIVNVPALITQVMEQVPVHDLSIQEVEIEHVVKEIYGGTPAADFDG